MRELSEPLPPASPLEANLLAEFADLLPDRGRRRPDRLTAHQRHDIHGQTRRLSVEPEVVHRLTGLRIRHLEAGLGAPLRVQSRLLLVTPVGAGHKDVDVVMLARREKRIYERTHQRVQVLKSATGHVSRSRQPAATPCHRP